MSNRGHSVRLGRSYKRCTSFHGVWMGIQVLYIECKSCNWRAALGPADLSAIHRGNLTYIRDAKFKCGKCGPTPVRCYIPLTQDEVDTFSGGHPLPPSRRVC